MSTPSRRWAAASVAILSLTGCVGYEPDPVEPLALLEALEAVDVAAVSSAEVAPILTAFDPADGLTLREASAVAVRRNPQVVALRARVGVTEAQFVQAGLLPDPVIGWDAMDAGAAGIVDGRVPGAAWTAGFGLTWRVPRPGEIDAQEGVARARIGGAAAALAQAEWALVRAVHLAYVRLLVAQARTRQTRRLAHIAQRALSYFERARKAGAATALEESLARVASDGVAADLVRAETEALAARQALNRLLGLRPGARWRLQDDLRRLPPRRPTEDARALVADALRRRPDVRAALAAHAQAEEQLRLQVARQWPKLTIGTSISLQLPIFSRLNHPAIETARRRRDATRLAARVAVQRTRAQVHAALVQARQAYRLLEIYRARLGPQTEATLRITQQAFRAREVTPLQILTAQRQVLETQARYLAARRGWAEARVRLDSACGRLLPTALTPAPASATDEESP